MTMRAKLLRSINSAIPTISIRAITPIVEDSQNYDLRELKIEYHVLSLKDVSKQAHPNADSNLVNLRFIEYVSDNDTHKLNAQLTIYFERNKKTYKMELFGWISAIYTDPNLVVKMQEYLYWYMTKSLEENDAFMKFKEIRFPDTLMSFYRNDPGWQRVNLMDFSWVDTDATDSISKITHGLLDNRSFMTTESSEKSEDGDLKVDVRFDTPLHAAYNDVDENHRQYGKIQVSSVYGVTGNK